MAIDTQANIILENDVALLRPMSKKDFELLLPFSLNEPTLWQYSLQPAHGEENLSKYMSKALDDRAAGASYPFVVIDKRTNEIAGSTRFYDIQKGHNTVQLGFTWYGNKFWGTGLNKNCKLLILTFAFEKWQVDRVEFRADNDNARSIAAMKSIGCIPEGVLRSNCAGHEGRRDSIVLSILKNEWTTGVKDALQQKIG